MKTRMKRKVAAVLGVILLLLCLLCAMAFFGTPLKWYRAAQVAGRYTELMYPTEDLQWKNMKFDASYGDRFYCDLVNKTDGSVKTRVVIYPDAKLIYDDAQSRNGEFEASFASTVQKALSGALPDASRVEVRTAPHTGGWEMLERGGVVFFEAHPLTGGDGQLHNQIRITVPGQYSEKNACGILRAMDAACSGAPISARFYIEVTLLFNGAELRVQRLPSSYIQENMEERLRSGLAQGADADSLSGEEKAAFDRGEAPVFSLKRTS